MYKLVKQSYFIELFFNDILISNASGFFFKYNGRSYFITNKHVAFGIHIDTGKPLSDLGSLPNRIIIYKPITNDILYEWSWNEIEPDIFWIATFDNHLDIAIRRIPSNEIEMDIEWVDILVGEKWEVNITEKITVVGYPYGNKVSTRIPCCITGYVATDIDLDFDDSPLFLIDSRTRKGMSGSPVYYYVMTGQGINKIDGSIDFGFGDKNTPLIEKFLGIYSGRINEESDLGKVWKVEAILGLINSNN